MIVYEQKMWCRCGVDVVWFSNVLINFVDLVFSYDKQINLQILFMVLKRMVLSRCGWPQAVLRALSVILLTMVCRTARADVYSGKAWDDTSVVSETKDRPNIKTNDANNYVITISTPQQLAWYAMKTRTETNSSELSKYVHADIVLAADLNMSGHSWRGIGESGGSDRDFQGTFDGQGHTISNLVCERYNDDDNAGLFDELRYSVEIKNVRFYKCQSFAPEEAAGIVTGCVNSTSDVKFTNLTFDECFVQAGDDDGGIVVGRIAASKNIVFDNITIRKGEFSKVCGERYGGITGCFGWGDCSVVVRNSFISLRNLKQKTLTRMGCVIGFMDHGSRLEVDNCVFDLTSSFFTGNPDQGAIVGRWNDSSKPMVSHTLVMGNPELPNGSNAGLFAGYTSSSSSMELSDCFIDINKSVDLKKYHLVSDDIVNANRCVVRNVRNIDYGEASAREAGAVVQMNRNGACFGIYDGYKNTTDAKNLMYFVIPLSDASQGKLLGFSGKDRVTAVSGGVPAELTMNNSYNYVVMAQGRTMNYTVKEDVNKWVIEDNSTNISGKKRVGKWEFSGTPSAEGELKFNMVERPKASMIDNLCNFNATTQRVTLTWQVTNADVFKKYWKNQGKWYIYRNNELIDSVESSKDTWTDFAPVNKKDNAYSIYFVSRPYKYDKGDNKDYPKKTFYVDYKVTLDVSSPVISNGKVVNSVGVPNASSINGCRVRLLKWDTDIDIKCNHDVNTVISKADELKLCVYQGQVLFNQLKDDEYLYVSYEDDRSVGSLCTSYYYLWLVDNFPNGPFKGSSCNSGKLNLINDSQVKFSSFSATKGKSTSKISLKWNTENKNNESLRYVIERKAYDEESDNWTTVYETSSSLNSGSYEDEVLPGYVYRYRIRLYPFCETYESVVDAKSEANDIGFAASRGTIQGRITFSSGKNTEEGVDVRLQPDENELATSMTSYAMMFRKTDQTMPLAGGLGNAFWDGDWTIQFLLRSDEEESGRLLTVPGRIFLNLVNESGGTIICINGNKSFNIPVNDGTYEGNYIVIQHDRNGYRLGKTVYDSDSQKTSMIWAKTSPQDVGGVKTDTLCFGFYNVAQSFKESFKGGVDEVRVWDGCLSEKSIADTYNRYLSGNEKGLMAYYTFDSGVSEYAFDSSHPSGNWNNRHMELKGNRPLLTSDCIPESSVLAYRSTTDSNGEYTISGIPFEGEGTNWQIVPSLGAHDFSPASTRRLVSTSTLVHSNIDFTDISSFRVSGKVYYENTNIPVQGCNIMVDGVTVSEGSALVETNYDGEFSVDVPIGTHTLSMSMNGHTFTDSLTMYFNKPVKDLWFYDNTKVTVAGRVCGGEQEYARPIGLEQSGNNIGTAYITLAPSNDNYYFTAETDRNHLYIIPSDRQVDYSNPLKYYNNSRAHTGKAVSETDMGDANRIYIKTDSLTGEFAACLPPMRYEVVSITIPSADEEINGKLQQNLSYLDARNVTDVQTDSVWNGQITPEGEPVYDKFAYNTLYKVMVTTPAVLEVWQDEDDMNFFGEDTVTYFVSEGKEEKFVAYKDGAYTIGAEGSENRPVFNQFENYVFYLRASQKYYNRDNRNNIVEDVMPMAYKTVTVNNTMAYENYWYVDENGVTGFVESDGLELELDSLGCGIYKFKTGTPNTTAPFEETISMVLDYGLDDFNLTGVLLGAVGYGNSFTTRGPDLVSMILRDPPGSNSYATWTKGSSITSGYRCIDTSEYGNGEHTKLEVGPGGTLIGLGDINTWGVFATEDQDWLVASGHNDVDGWTITTTTTRDISTSSAPEFDGPEADLFIGNSINVVSGNGKKVTLVKIGNEWKLGLKNVKTSSFTFNTSFVYSQYQVKTTVIPNLLAERRNLIQDPETVPSDSNLHYKPVIEFDKWMSLSDDEKDAMLDKGAGEGYTIWAFVDSVLGADSIMLYGMWADNWRGLLRDNEKAKVDAYTGNYLKDNYTFDAASSQTITTTTDSMTILDDHTDIGGHTTDSFVGVRLLGWVKMVVGDFTGGYHRTELHRTETRNYKEQENQEAFSFTLAEDGVNDVLTVDRMAAPDGYSDIFRTRAGQTSGFWAPQYVTEYYMPGTEIMAPTLMVNRPKLELVNPEQQIISNIRRGTAATVQFRLINESESKSNGYYRMCLEAESNKNGARCSYNGYPLDNEGILVWLEYGKPQIITVNIEEPQNPVDDSYNLNFYLIDDKQTLITGPMGIYPSEVHVIANFVKSSSEISLDADRTVINAESVRTGNGKVSFQLKDYDVNMKNLLYIELQMWNGTRYISVGEGARWERTQDMAESVSYSIDMSDMNNYPDGEYIFRARTVSDYGEGMVEAYSSDISVIKDTSAPQPVSNLMPVRGVLGNDNEISVEFNEDIVGDIRQHTNVELYGELNQSASAREVSVFFNGTDNVVSTEVPISSLQSGTARSFNLWLKWMGGKGTILSCGAGESSDKFGVDDDGHLMICSNGDTLVSATAFEMDKWAFVSIITDATNTDAPTKVTASYILEEGKDVVWLIGNSDGGKPLNGKESTAAPFILGSGFHGCIQDLSMWNGVRDMATSNNEKALKKTRYTPNLMAYWPLSEGFGKIAKEVVSEQNMHLSSEDMWSIDNRNYSMRLDKGQRAQLIFSNVNTGYDEDYLLQMWFNVDQDVYLRNSGELDTLVSYPNGNTSFVIPRGSGNLVLLCKNDSVAIGDRNIADGHWHQLSMMVKKSENGNAVVYLDGSNVAQVAARKVDSMQGVLFLGDRGGFSGYFDEIRIWNGLQNSQTISDNLNMRYSTTDCPIAAYFPFEVSGENQAVDFTLGNYGNMKADGDTVRLVSTDPNVPLSQLVIAQEEEIVPPLKSVPTLVTRDFSIVSSERKIRINIDENEIRDVQGTTVTALVRGLHDKAGNMIQDIRWSFLVEMNDIEWGDIMTVDYDFERYADYLGIAKIRNNTGIEQNWRIEGAPDWMVLSSYGGVLKPAETISVNIHAKESIPVGTNTGMLSLVDDKGIYHKQTYSISNVPNSPDWAVDSLYSQVMTVTGQVRVNKVIKENSSSILAAFNELGDCVGVASPQYVREKNSYYYTLMIYGNEWYIGRTLTFKFYDAGSGTYYASVVPDEPIVFGGDYAKYGSIEDPVYWDTTGKIEQIIYISKGWNWISFNIQEPDAISNVFSSEIYTEVKNKDNFARFYRGRWEHDNEFQGVTFGCMYKVYATMPDTISRIGTPANQAIGNNSRISIAEMKNGKPGWSWIGANVTVNMPLTTALGGLSKAPEIGDVIKNYDQYSEYTASGWIGDLTTIVPGKGYMYMSNDVNSKYLVYPTEHLNSKKKTSEAKFASEPEGDPYAEYAGSATLIAAVEADGVRVSNCRVYAVDADGNIRGCKPVSYINNKYLAFLVVHGNEPEQIRFIVEFGGGRNLHRVESSTVLNYYDGLSLGRSDDPFIISIGEVTDIDVIGSGQDSDTMYDLLGRPVSNESAVSRGVYIQEDRKLFVK